MKTFAEVLEKAKKSPRKYVAVAAAADKPVLEAIKEAVESGLAGAYLVGNADEIKTIADEIDFNLDQTEVIDEKDAKKAALTAVRLVHDGKAHVLMKGLISSADFLRATLNKETGLRTGSILSSVAVLKSLKIDRFLLMTDGGMVMYPSLEEKVKLLQNTLPVCKALNIKNPKAAAICAVEVVNPSMQSTVDAASLAMMSQRGQIKGMTVDGPLAMDNALSEEAAAHKGIKSEVAGKADVLLMPDINAGNIMYKSMVYTGETETCALIMGAAAPVIMTSRADSAKTKLNSIAVALLIN